ncbi:hypothetical protein JCM33374_g3158 [Metschnikowia sp. JCM 33374]|nr:hypothetical protein JCM33374_g3158 [Metschnikowia sp. JCM 33374]
MELQKLPQNPSSPAWNDAINSGETGDTQTLFVSDPDLTAGLVPRDSQELEIFSVPSSPSPTPSPLSSRLRRTARSRRYSGQDHLSTRLIGDKIGSEGVSTSTSTSEYVNQLDFEGDTSAFENGHLAVSEKDKDTENGMKKEPEMDSDSGGSEYQEDRDPDTESSSQPKKEPSPQPQLKSEPKFSTRKRGASRQQKDHQTNNKKQRGDAMVSRRTRSNIEKHSFRVEGNVTVIIDSSDIDSDGYDGEMQLVKASDIKKEHKSDSETMPGSVAENALSLSDNMKSAQSEVEINHRPDTHTELQVALLNEQGPVDDAESSEQETAPGGGSEYVKVLALQNNEIEPEQDVHGSHNSTEEETERYSENSEIDSAIDSGNEAAVFEHEHDSQIQDQDWANNIEIGSEPEHGNQNEHEVQLESKRQHEPNLGPVSDSEIIEIGSDSSEDNDDNDADNECDINFQGQTSLRSKRLLRGTSNPRTAKLLPSRRNSNSIPGKYPARSSQAEPTTTVSKSLVQKTKKLIGNGSSQSASEDSAPQAERSAHKVEEIPGNGHFKCDEPKCGQVLKTKLLLQSHKKGHDGRGRLKCYYCTWTTTRLDFRDTHMAATHSNDYDKIRDQKRKEFFLDLTTSGDEESHTYRRYTCDVPGCDKSFQRSDHLDSHMIFHSKIRTCKPEKCNDCGEPLKNKTLLRAHIREKHPETDCKICGKTFTTRGLKIHMNAHEKHAQEEKFEHAQKLIQGEANYDDQEENEDKDDQDKDDHDLDDKDDKDDHDLDDKDDKDDHDLDDKDDKDDSDDSDDSDDRDHHDDRDDKDGKDDSDDSDDRDHHVGDDHDKGDRDDKDDKDDGKDKLDHHVEDHLDVEVDLGDHFDDDKDGQDDHVDDDKDDHVDDDKDDHVDDDKDDHVDDDKDDHVDDDKDDHVNDDKDDKDDHVNDDKDDKDDHVNDDKDDHVNDDKG